MSHFRNVKFSGNVGMEPERKQIGTNDALVFTVFAQNRRKNKDTGEYENFGDNEPVRVTLWRDLANMDIRKGDLVEVTGALSIRRYVKSGGTPGQSLETDFIEEVRVIFRKDGEAPSSLQQSREPVGAGSSPFSNLSNPF